MKSKYNGGKCVHCKKKLQSSHNKFLVVDIRTNRGHLNCATLDCFLKMVNDPNYHISDVVKCSCCNDPFFGQGWGFNKFVDITRITARSVTPIEDFFICVKCNRDFHNNNKTGLPIINWIALRKLQNA